MRCGTCERDNRADARFCAGCGQPLARRCGRCERVLAPDAAFCDGCGSPVADRPAVAPDGPTAAEPSAPPANDPRAYTPKHLADRILTSRGALEGERKVVSVLFADLEGFTALSEQNDPEVMHRLMDRFFQLVLNEVHRYEGTVNQFLGDGVMALFGAPIALEDAPRRAVLAAIAIQRGVATLGRGIPALDERGLPLRIGVHSGPVVVGSIGDDLRMDYTAVGDTTNLAARLQAQAPPGEILISDATRRGVEGYFDLEDLGERPMKGVSAPVRALRVVAERPVSGRIDAVGDAGLTPLVGRQPELWTLRSSFEAAREGRGQACFLVGEAGIGKSRLLHEFRRELADEPHTWFEGRCASYGGDTAFQSIVDGVRRLVQIDDRDADDPALEKLGAGIERLGDDLAWTLPYLQRLLSLPVSDPAVEELDAIIRRGETIRALYTLFMRFAEQRPFVFVVEDLHWIDPASEEFLAFVIESIPAARVLMLMTHRPGYDHPFGDRSYHVRVALQSLSPGEMATMAGALLDASELPIALRDLIADKAEGNPFFVEEVTRSLLEEGVLRQADGRVELARDLSDITIPDRIQDILMARIDRLDEEPKRAIQVASVIGREFALRLLERIVEAGEAMSSVVGELRALELIYQKAAHPELAFMFKHALTHDVAYESVLLQRRRALHRIVGSSIEELYADRLAEHYEALAHHFSQAEEWDRALLYHHRAAEKAMDAFANYSAAEHFRKALEIADRLGDDVTNEHRRSLAEGLGRVCFAVNEFRESADQLVAAAACTEDPAEGARLMACASHSYLWGHYYDDAERAATEAIRIAETCDARAARIIATTERSHYTTTTSGLRAIANLPAHSAELSRAALETGDDEAIAHSLQLEGLWAEMRGEYRLAIEKSRLAGEHGQRTGNPLCVFLPQWVVGLALTCLGEYEQSLRLFREAHEFSLRIGDRAMRSRIQNSLGWLYAELGCHEEAETFNREGADLALELFELGLVAGIPEIRGNAIVNAAGNRISLGDVDGARELLQPIQEELDTPGDPWQRWRYALHLWDALARAELADGEPERALALVEREVEGARAQLSRKLEARALELHGRVLLTLDRRDEAALAVDQALEASRAIGYPPVTWRALSLRAEIARRTGDAASADPVAAEARGLVERLASSISDAALRNSLGSLGERLVSDPLGAYR